MKIDEDVELYLFKGKDIIIDEFIVLKSHKLEYIVEEVGYKKYMSLLYYICNTPYELRTQLYKEGVLYTDITHWQLFINFFNGGTDGIMKDVFDKFLSLNFNDYVLNVYDDEIVMENVKNNHKIDEFKFLYIVSILRESGGLGNKKEPIFGNKTGLIYDIEREQRRMTKGRFKSKTTLKSIMSSISWNSSVNIFQIWNLTLYQLYDGLNSKVKKNNYDNIMLGIYTGNIKFDSIDFNKENWFNK